MALTSKAISDGDTINYTPGSAVTAGDVVVVGEIVAHAPNNISASVEGVLQIEGIIEFPKDSGSGTALTQGQRVYWDASNEVITGTAASHKIAGYVAEAAGTTATTVQVKLARL